MANHDEVRTIIGIIGNCISFGLFLSPMPTFYKIWKRKSVEEFSPVPYLATVMNCALWILYGLPVVHPHSILVITINGIGFVIEASYLIIYMTYANNKQRVKVMKIFAGEVILYTAIVLITFLCFHTFDKRSLFVGVLCVIFVVGMYASPLTVMRMVIQTKSVKYMPFTLSLANFFNGIIWVVYALLRFDPFILVGNGLGAISGAAQLILYACYFKSTPKDDDDTPAAELQFASV